jgi:hypothetical protein
MTQFKAGDPKKGGRAKGTRNKTSEQLRATIQTFIELNWQRIQADFDAMKPAERLSFLNSLLKLILPPPIVPEQLSEHQLEQLLGYIQKRYSDEQN